MLLARFDLEVMQRIQVILDLLECSSGGLAVGGNGAIVLRQSDVGGSAPATMIKENLGKCGTDREEAARPKENQLIADVPAKPATAESDSVG